jgi:hypothetical protein
MGDAIMRESKGGMGQMGKKWGKKKGMAQTEAKGLEAGKALNENQRKWGEEEAKS